MTAGLWVERGGSGQPTLLMLHGLGANATVWEPLLPLVRARWPGRWIAPDLRGHGRSPHLRPYALGTHAADVAGLTDPEDEVVVLGHSMGGAVGMGLGSGWFGLRLRAVIAFGVKLVWSEAEIAKAHELARQPVRWFETRDAAIDRHLRVAGLQGLVAPDSPAAAVGVVEESGRFRLALDPRVSEVVGTHLDAVAAALRAPLRLIAGSRDPMVTAEQMRRLDPDAVVLEGLGHNLHLEAPERLWPLVETALQPTRTG